MPRTCYEYVCVLVIKQRNTHAATNGHWTSLRVALDVAIYFVARATKRYEKIQHNINTSLLQKIGNPVNLGPFKISDRLWVESNYNHVILCNQLSIRNNCNKNGSQSKKINILYSNNQQPKAFAMSQPERSPDNKYLTQSSCYQHYHYHPQLPTNGPNNPVFPLSNHSRPPINMYHPKSRCLKAFSSWKYSVKTSKKARAVARAERARCPCSAHARARVPSGEAGAEGLDSLYKPPRPSCFNHSLLSSTSVHVTRLQDFLGRT